MTKKFCCSTGILSAVVVFSCLMYVSCSSAGEARTQFALGTVCTINAYADGTDALYNELFERISQIENEFSVNIPASVVSQINDAAGDHPVSVDKDMLYVTQTALKYAALTNGAFDPTVGPLVKLWGINTDHARVPEQKEIDMILPLINWRDVVVTKNGTGTGGTVFLVRKGMSLDFGGIAKGFTADELVSILQKHKIKRAVIDLGGNIYVYGKKKDGGLWKVGVKNPADVSGDPALIIGLSNSTVVTSGVYERFIIQNGIRYHHILNTKTGYPAQTGLASSTIISESSIAADALSTSVFLLGTDKGMQLLTNIQSDKTLGTVPGLNTEVSAVFIADDGSITASKALEPVMKVSDGYRGSVLFR
jgi:FAD:protein FMN transferase